MAPVEDVLDPAFGRLGVPPMIVVMPDGWSSHGCGQWVDSPVTGNFEQYVIQDVIGFVDKTYRTIPTAASRGVFGFSSGGFGSWNLHWGHRLLSHYLTDAGVPHVHMENPGNHGGRWPERYQVALKWLAEVLEHEPA